MTNFMQLKKFLQNEVLLVFIVLNSVPPFSYQMKQYKTMLLSWSLWPQIAHMHALDAIMIYNPSIFGISLEDFATKNSKWIF